MKQILVRKYEPRDYEAVIENILPGMRSNWGEVYRNTLNGTKLRPLFIRTVFLSTVWHLSCNLNVLLAAFVVYELFLVKFVIQRCIFGSYIK